MFFRVLLVGFGLFRPGIARAPLLFTLYYFYLELNISSSLDIKKRIRIRNRGNPYIIPIGISINSHL